MPRDAAPPSASCPGAGRGKSTFRRRQRTWREVEREGVWPRRSFQKPLGLGAPAPGWRLLIRRQLLFCSPPRWGRKRALLGAEDLCKGRKITSQPLPTGREPGPASTAGQAWAAAGGSCHADRFTAGPAKPPSGWASLRPALPYWKGGSGGQEAPGQPAPTPAKRQGGFSMWGAKPKLWALFSCKSKTKNLEPSSCRCGWRGKAASAQEPRWAAWPRCGAGHVARFPSCLGHPPPQNLGWVNWEAQGLWGCQGQQDDRGEPQRCGVCSRCSGRVRPVGHPLGDSVFPSSRRTELPRAEVFTGSVHLGAAAGVSTSFSLSSTRAAPLKSVPRCGLLGEDLLASCTRGPQGPPPTALVYPSFV